MGLYFFVFFYLYLYLMDLGRNYIDQIYFWIFNSCIQVIFSLRLGGIFKILQCNLGLCRSILFLDSANFSFFSLRDVKACGGIVGRIFFFSIFGVSPGYRRGIAWLSQGVHFNFCPDSQSYWLQVQEEWFVCALKPGSCQMTMVIT